MTVRNRQPDERIHPGNLGMMIMGDKRFVVNLRPGVPFNACVEEFRNGGLRCWASYAWLNDRAAGLVKRHATKTEKGAFTWNEGVRRGRRFTIKGGHELFKVIFP